MIQTEDYQSLADQYGADMALFMWKFDRHANRLDKRPELLAVRNRVGEMLDLGNSDQEIADYLATTEFNRQDVYWLNSVIRGRRASYGFEQDTDKRLTKLETKDRQW